ncbi:flippase [Oscillatoria sp. CS-180]|uniref:flippase n=1 Tax=Oscillatoria sp. CS-180 TaxID=3021720 RepID=UPI00232EB8EE|nr:flippase [Oscillatoria sp. CS-180]MDB9528193.1 flippase [Oscillatoria sp. CS-180]
MRLLSRFDLSYVYAFLGEATLALNFVLYIFIARILGPEQFGIFAAAIALAGILSLFIQFGLPRFTNREIAAQPETATRSIALFLLVECLTSLAVLIVFLPFALVFGYREKVLAVYYLALIAEVGRAVILTLRNAIKGLGWFRSESIVVFIERTVVFLLAALVLFRTQNLVLVISAMAIARVAFSLSLLFYLSRKVRVFSPIRWAKIITTIKAAYPFAISGVLWILYYQVDIVMLEALSTKAETGFYSASYRVLEIFSALPRVIFYVIFTRLAKYQVSAPERLSEQLYKATRLLLLTVIPLVFLAGTFQTNLIQALYSDEFTRSIQSLSILLPSLAVKVFGTISEQFLQATGKERKVPRILMAAALSNVVVNAVLIPRFASVGAAIATLLSECIMATFGLRILAQTGYSRASLNIVLIAILSFFITTIPTLILYGLSPLIGGVLALPCIALLLYRMKPSYFKESSADV